MASAMIQPDNSIVSASKFKVKSWIESAFDLETLRQKNLEEEIKLGQKKLELERVRLAVHEQRVRQLSNARKQVHLKKELLKKMMRERQQNQESKEGLRKFRAYFIWV